MKAGIIVESRRSLCSCILDNTLRLRCPFEPIRSQLKQLPLAPAYRQTRALSSSNSQQPKKFRRPFHVEKTAKMSWMDSWSRPSKSQATPAPYYLLPGGESTPYCKTCGRVIGEGFHLTCIVTRLEVRLTQVRCAQNGCQQEPDTCKALLK
jgi:hypothetical protein